MLMAGDMRSLFETLHLRSPRRFTPRARLVTRRPLVEIDDGRRDGLALVTNRLFYGDNLDVLRNHVADASIDLVHLDPPFNSNRAYNVISARRPRMQL